LDYREGSTGYKFTLGGSATESIGILAFLYRDGVIPSEARRLKDCRLIIPCFFDALQDVLLGRVKTFLGRSPRCFAGAPPARGLLDAADVQDAVVKVVEDRSIRPLPKKCLVGVHAVSSKQSDALVGDVGLNVSQQPLGCLLRYDRRPNYGSR